MSGKSIISNSYLEDIGDAIRYKKGTDQTFYPSQMGDAIRSIEGIVPVGSIEIDANGTYDVTEKAEAVVSVQPDLRPLSVSENGTYEPDDFDGYSDVTVDVEPALESLTVTENGLYLPSAGVDGYDRVTVNVPPTVPDLRPLSVDSLTQSGTFVPDGFDGYDSVTVEDEWDSSLVPDENNAGFFHCRVINLLATDTLVIDGYGTGYRWANTKSNMPTFVYWGAQFGTGAETQDAVHARIWLVPAGDTTVVVGGPAWGVDGAVYTGNYSFKGEYLKYKVIHQP